MRLLSAAAVLASSGLGLERTTALGRRARDVNLGINEDLCLFENDDDKWCFSITPPMAVVGWDIQQTYTETPKTTSPVIEYY